MIVYEKNIVSHNIFSNYRTVGQVKSPDHSSRLRNSGRLSYLKMALGISRRLWRLVHVHSPQKYASFLEHVIEQFHKLPTYNELFTVCSIHIWYWYFFWGRNAFKCKHLLKHVRLGFALLGSHQVQHVNHAAFEDSLRSNQQVALLHNA